MVWNNWRHRWEAAHEACLRLGGEVRPLVIDPPATEDEVQAVESALGFKLPASFREVLLTFSKHVEFRWFLPDGLRRPTPLQGIFAGDCHWDLDDLAEMEAARVHWVDACFPNPDDSYDRVWHNKLSFGNVGDGDHVAIDLTSGAVVYLGHAGSSEHGYMLGTDFADFVDRATQLGCPGYDDFQMRPFLPSPTSGLDPVSPNAKLWRSWFGLPE